MNFFVAFALIRRSRISLIKFHNNTGFHVRRIHDITPEAKCEKLSSKKIRQLFLDYFVKEKKHNYVHSSSVFLNNDPTLLFVNAGMNQFRSLLLNKIQPGHQFYNLKTAANSQKCIRLSGKHNDLKDVGHDLHHHTFFEMLGNWSFGDYSKRQACEMAWELLTKVYNLNPENLYITYFGGSKILGVPADEECRSIWLDIGVPSDHIFPFGVEENFWEMADVGPCGPCTEIHYDYLGSGPNSAAKRINADKPDLIELWNLVFIQYNRQQNGSLKHIPFLNVDTGMGFERLTAVLQGTMSNYDTDIFIPLFKAIEKNFSVKPYEGRVGSWDSDGIDSAYRILADHSRMFSVAIADGLFPDNYDAGHVLRKIIRRASYAANRVMKGRPGVLSSLVPVVADSLDFFPEVNKNVKEIVDIVNEEEKLFHQLINRGRKARNKMMSENNSNILSGPQLWQLKQNYGLEEVVLKDLASEINLSLDWESYEKVCKEKKEDEKNQFKEKSDAFDTIVTALQSKSVPKTDDSFKYNYSTNKNDYGIESVTASVLGIIVNEQLVANAEVGSQCYLVMDKTNFYSEAGGQTADIGDIYNEEFTFKVGHVSSSKGYVLHSGTVISGTVKEGSSAELCVDKDHRLACSQNHSATHLLNSTLRNILPYTSQRSSVVGPLNLRLGFSAKSALTSKQIEEVEVNINEIIKKDMKISRTDMPFEVLLDDPKAVIIRGEEYPESVSVISVGNEEILSLEPCCGTHVHSTSDIGEFVVIPSKSHGGSTRIISAVTGHQASLIKKNGEEVLNRVFELKKKIDEITMVSDDVLSKLLKEVKCTLKDCHVMQDAPLGTLRKCENILQDLKLKLNDMLSSCSVSENEVSNVSADENKMKVKISENVINSLLSRNIPATDDDCKYDWLREGSNSVESRILAIIRDNEFVDYVKRGLNCQLVLNKTNFYAEDDDQASDEGVISCEDFIFKVSNVIKVNGYVFHDGYVEEGSATAEKIVKSIVNEEHRLSCSQNHTALHLLNAALREELPYAFQNIAYAGAKDLLLTFSSKISLSDLQLRNIERKVNEAVQANLNVTKFKTFVESLKDFPLYKLPVIKKSKDSVPVISIGKDGEIPVLKSVEPCCGTHVHYTGDIGSFIIISSKSKSTKEKVIRAVTGKQAEIVRKNGEIYEQEMLKLEDYVSLCLQKNKIDYFELWDCLKELKVAKGYHEIDLPVLLFRKHQKELSELTKKLTEATHDFVQQGFKKVSSEMKKVLSENSHKPFIVHKLQSVGDGKKIINFALDSSQDKPVMYFAQDGYKSIICSCSVPKHLVQPSFSALLWINSVASVLEGRARTLTKDTELLYSVICSKTDNLDKAIVLAEEFAKSHLKMNSL